MTKTSSEIHSQTALWNSPFGQRLAQQEVGLLQPLLRRLHGDAVLWIGDQPELPNALTQCMVRLPLQLSTDCAAVSESESEGPRLVLGRFDSLPFATNSLDGVVLHHALEAGRDARICIREVERVLKPGGRVIVCAFNRYSITGLRGLILRSHSNPLFKQAMLSPLRLLDWLALLNLRPDESMKFYSLTGPKLRPVIVGLKQRIIGFLPSNMGFWRLPYRFLRQGSRLVAKIAAQLPLGGVVVVSAIKERQGGSLIGRRNASGSKARGKLILAPTARSEHDD